MFEPLGIGPLPGPGTPEEFAGRTGRPGGRRSEPVGLCRIDGIGDDQAPTSSSSRFILTTLAAASGGPCCGPGAPGPPTHGYAEITLATYRDVPWNGPFYASEGFVERGPVDDFLRAHGLPPEEPVMGRFGSRVLMVKSL